MAGLMTRHLSDFKRVSIFARPSLGAKQEAGIQTQDAALDLLDLLEKQTSKD